jgi:putative copper export protein
LSGPPDLLLAAAHWIEYLGLLGGLGSFVVRRLGRQRPRIQWANPPMELAFTAALLGGLAVVGGEALRSGALPQWFGVTRVVAEGVALVLCVRGIPAVAPAAVLAAVLLPLGGHAAGVLPAGGAELADALHVLSAGMWAGGILALASLHPPDGWKGPEARLLLERFAGVALIAFAVTALTGVLRATEQLASLSDLWTTSYGVVLTVKSLGVVVMLALSSLVWRRGLPVARLEAGVAALVIALTALLAAYPLPA